MFVGKDFRLGSTGVVKHEIHTRRPPIKASVSSSESRSSTTGARAVKGDAG